MSHTSGLVAMAVASVRAAVAGSEAQESSSLIPDAETQKSALLDSFSNISSCCLLQEVNISSCSPADLMQHVKTAHMAMVALTDTELGQLMLAQNVQRFMHGQLLPDIPGLCPSDWTLIQTLKQDLLLRQQNTHTAEASRSPVLCETLKKQHGPAAPPDQGSPVGNIMDASLVTSAEACTDSQDLGGQDQGHHHQESNPQDTDLIPQQLHESTFSCSISNSAVQALLPIDASLALCQTGDLDTASSLTENTASTTTAPFLAQETHLITEVDDENESQELEEESDDSEEADPTDAANIAQSDIADGGRPDDLVWGSGGGSGIGEDNQNSRAMSEFHSVPGSPESVAHTTHSMHSPCISHSLTHSRSCSSTSDHLSASIMEGDAAATAHVVQQNATVAVDEVSEDGAAGGIEHSDAAEEGEDVSYVMGSPSMDSRLVRQPLADPNLDSMGQVTSSEVQTQAIPGRLKRVGVVCSGESHYASD